MNSTFAIGLSGMAAAQAQLSAAAHNIAHAPVPGARRLAAPAETAPGGGVSTRQALAPDASAGVDYAADLVAQRQAAHHFTANLRVVQTADQALGTLLDIRA